VPIKHKVEVIAVKKLILLSLLVFPFLFAGRQAHSNGMSPPADVPKGLYESFEGDYRAIQSSCSHIPNIKVTTNRQKDTLSASESLFSFSRFNEGRFSMYTQRDRFHRKMWYDKSVQAYATSEGFAIQNWGYGAQHFGDGVFKEFTEALSRIEIRGTKLLYWRSYSDAAGPQNYDRDYKIKKLAKPDCVFLKL